MEVEIRSAYKTHPLVHTCGHMHYIACMQRQCRSSRLARTPHAFTHECSANSLTTRCRRDGQQACFRRCEGDRRTVENCSSRKQQNGAHKSVVLFSNDLLGRLHISEPGQNSLPIFFPMCRHNVSVLLEG